MAKPGQPQSPGVGESVGRYRLEERLGAGGCGEVFTAYHIETLESAAVKLLHPEHAGDRGLVERFLAEARAAKEIDHPGVARVFESGELNGLPYLVMELLEGESLEARIKRDAPLPIEEALSIAAQAARALHAAHQRGVVHRDVKPDNLFLLEGTPPTVKVLDFGIAKLLDASLRAGVHTHTGHILGTPHYMSPEQCLMRKDVDARADIYSLGVVLFQMLTGRLPFDAESLAALIMAHMSDSPRRPSALNDAVTDAIDGVVLQTLAKDPGHRFRDMAELAEALERLIDAPTQPVDFGDAPTEPPDPPLFGAPGLALPDAAPVPAARQAAVIIEGYRLGQLLGSGLTGEVYAATHEAGGRKAAVKLLHPELARLEAARRAYLDEAQQSSRVLSHSVCGVLSAGQHDGRHYLMMELVEGAPLAAFMGKGRAMPEPDVASIGVALAEALAAAHDRSLVHGHLSPTNVLLTRDQNTGAVIPVITDFGIHHLLSAKGLTDGTPFGRPAGDPRYMAPEQTSSLAGLHPAADVFATGVLLYELLVGAPPFDDVPPRPEETRVGAPPRLAIPPRSRVQHVSAGMEGVLLKALRPRWRDRFRSMRDLADALGYVNDRHKEVVRRVDAAFGGVVAAARTAKEQAEQIAAKLQAMVTDKLESEELALPALPATVNQAIGMLDNPRTAIREVSVLLDKDPVLAAQVLKVANSPMFMGSGKAATIDHAVTRLGAANLRAILVECSAHQLFQSRVASIRREMETVWSHSVAVACVTRELVRAKGGPDPALAYMAGLLHDVGKPVVGGLLLDLEKQLAQQDRKFMDHAMWSRVVGASHRAAGACVVRAWNLHEDILAALEKFDDYDEQEPLQLSNFVCLANHIAKRERPYSGEIDPDELEEAIRRGVTLFSLEEEQLSHVAGVAQAA